ncbi:MAG: hypothetical protein LBI99_08520 [Propionibacteriaceae bacterium]|jgi:hypothetical protein|nr:hypothetical protein [Propionibacteriaceae bacterium]
MTFTHGWEGPGLYASQLRPEQVRTDWTPRLPVIGIVPLRPLGLGDILGGAFRAVRFAPLAMLGLTLGVLLVAQLLGSLLGLIFARESITADPGMGMFSAPWSTISGLLAVMLTIVVVNTGLTHTVAEAIAGRRVPPLEALRLMGRRMWSALALFALIGLVIAAAVVVVAILFEAASDSGAASAIQLLVVLVLIGVAAGLAFGVKLLFAPCAIAVEGLGPLRAISRSWQLTRGVFWRTAGIYLLVSGIVWLAANMIMDVFVVVGLLLLAIVTAAVGENVAMSVIVVVATLASTVLTLPLTSAVTTLLYVDSRIRLEGYDIMLGEELYG